MEIGAEGQVIAMLLDDSDGHDDCAGFSEHVAHIPDSHVLHDEGHPGTSGFQFPDILAMICSSHVSYTA
jgi:hypothetical protein